MQRAAHQPTKSLIYACHAELAEASRRYRLTLDTLPYNHEIEQAAAAHHLPHEQAAAVVLNCWGHLHPVEARAVVVAERYVSQRRAGWTDRAALCLDDLRFYLAERTKLRAAFDTAVAEYQAARAAVDVRLAA